MKLGFSKPTENDEERRSLFSNFRNVGYDGLQLKHGQYREYISEPARFIEEWGHLPGVSSGIIAAGKLDDTGIASLRELFGFAGTVGCERVVFCHSVLRQEVDSSDIQQCARALSRLGKEAQQSGTTLSLHHHYGHPVMYREDLELFFDAVTDGTVGLTVDTAHLVKSGMDDVAGVIRDFGVVVDNVHLKDYADGEFRVLGQGSIDFAPIFAALNDIDFSSWVCADEESGSDLDGAMDICYRFMKAGLPGVSQQKL